MTAKEPLMMLGTNGFHDYFVIARKGNMALGIKPNQVAPGAKFGHSGTIWFGARLRSAPADGLFSDSNGVDNVVQLQKKFEAPGEAWDGVVWEKENSERASTTVGALLRGNLEGSVEEAKIIISEMREGKLATKLANYLAELAGTENLIMTVDELAAMLTEHCYAKIADKIEKAVEARHIVETEMEKSIGTFGMQAQILKKAYEKLSDTIEDADQDNEPTGTED